VASNDLELQLRIQADLKAALEELKRFKNGLDSQSDSARRAQGAMGGLAGSVKTLVGAWATLATVKTIIRIADDYGQMAARIKLATDSTEEYQYVQDRLLQSTKNTYRSLKEAQELYIQTADALRSLNYSTSDALDVSESLSLLFVTNATSAERASSAINAFSKSLQTGKVDAQSWQSLLLATPTLVDAIAESTGKSAQDIRQLGASGKLALTDLTEGLRKSLEANNQAAESMKTSVADGFTRVGTAASTLIGTLDEGTGATDLLAKKLTQLADWLGSGALAESLLSTFDLWQIAFEQTSDALSDLQADLGDLGEAGNDAIAFISKALKDLPRNVKTMTEIITVKAAALIDRRVSAEKSAIKAIVGFYKDGTKGLKKAWADFQREQAAIGEARFGSIEASLGEHENAETEYEKRKRQREEERAKRKAEYDQRQQALADARNKPRILNTGGAGDEGEQKRQDELERYVQGLEKQAALLGKNKEEVLAYEIAEKGLTGTLKERANAAQALLAAEHQKQQDDRNARTNADLQAQLLRAQGQETEAALAELRTRIAQQKNAFAEAGNQAGIAFLDKLLPIGEAKIRLEAIQREMNAVLERQRSAEQANQTQRDAGTINEYQARERLLQIHRQTREELALIRPQLEQMAALGGEIGEQASAALERLNAQSQQLASTCSLLQKTLSDGLTGGLEQALTGLAKGTLDLRGAITALATSVQDALLKMAAQNIAQSLVSKIMSAFGQGGATLQAGAAAVSQSALQMQAAGGSLQTGAAAVSAAAQQLAAASASMSASGAAGGASNGMGGLLGMFGGAGGAASGAGAAQGSSLGGGLSSSAGGAAAGGSSFGLYGMAMMAGSMFGSWLARRKASGGLVTGPGSGTSDSIPAWLSNGEYVIRASVTQQPGMQQLLASINQGGLEAFKRIKGIAKHSTGGLAGIPAPNFSAPSLGTAELPERESTTVENKVTVGLIDNPDKIGAFLASSEGETVLIDLMSKNPQPFRQIFGV